MSPLALKLSSKHLCQWEKPIEGIENVTNSHLFLIFSISFNFAPHYKLYSLNLLIPNEKN